MLLSADSSRTSGYGTPVRNAAGAAMSVPTRGRRLDPEQQAQAQDSSSTSSTPPQSHAAAAGASSTSLTPPQQPVARQRRASDNGHTSSAVAMMRSKGQAAAASVTPASAGTAARAASSSSSSSSSMPLSRHLNLARFLHTDLGRNIMLNRLRSGFVCLKHGSRGAPHFRFVSCTPDLQQVTWQDLQAKKLAPAPSSQTPSTVASSVPCSSILAVTLGHATRVLKERAATQKDCDPSRCFSLTTTTRTLDLECVSEQERDLWHLTFAFLIDVTTQRRASHLKQQQLSAQHHMQLQQSSDATRMSSDEHATRALTAALPDVPVNQLSLVHALEVLCDQSIGQAFARAQASQQAAATTTVAPLNSTQPAGALPAAVFGTSDAPEHRSAVQSPLHPVLHHPSSAAVAPAAATSDSLALPSVTEVSSAENDKSAVPDSKLSGAPEAQEEGAADPKHPQDETAKDATADKHVQDTKPLDAQVAAPAAPAASLAPPAVAAAPLLPTPPEARGHVYTGMGPSADSSGNVAASYLYPTTLEPDVLRASLQREVDAAREANRTLYIHSARRMVQLQDKIDALTRENVQLIRALKPTHW